MGAEANLSLQHIFIYVLNRHYYQNKQRLFKMNKLHKRLWIRYRDGFVKISLKDAQEICFRFGGKTDEGYSWTYEKYYRTGDEVFFESYSDSRDCDGHLTSEDYYILSGTHPCTSEYNFPRSNWERLKGSQTDSFAEAMGY